MRAQFRVWLQAIRTSFWFIPGLMLVAAILLSWITGALDVDLNLEMDQKAKEWSIWIGPSGARSILNTIAASMITVTSLVFSMTIIALTMAASNLGPRVIVYFIRDRVTQVSLGLFLATFVYAMLALLLIRESDAQAFVPYATLAVAILMSIVCFAWLILFIHRVAQEIQADTVVANIADELLLAIDDILSEVEEDDDPDASKESEAFDEEHSQAVISARTSGYVQLINYSEILKAAAEAQAIVRLHHRAGFFVVSGEPMATIASSEPGEEIGSEEKTKLEDVIASTISIGQKRTRGQDLEFSLRQLVEVGVRALSPGLNDFNTAVVTVDRVTGALALAFRRGLPGSVLADDNGTQRIWLSPITFDGLVSRGFNELRQCASGNVAVTIRLLEGLTKLAVVARTKGQREAISRQAESLMTDAKQTIRDSKDRDDVEQRYGAFLEALKQ